ncbi:MAG: FadR/GntR family transcriptional regulator, partial [Sphingomonadaceae bacterium]
MAGIADINDSFQTLRSLIDRQQETGQMKLPPEPELCGILGVSRGRLRTLLKRAEAEGLIWRHVGKGTFVGQRSLSEDTTISLSASAHDIFEARMVLEPQLAAYAAVHARPDDIAAMEETVEAMNRTETLVAWKRLDGKLHRQIAEAGHNMLLLLVYDTLRAQAGEALASR